MLLRTRVVVGASIALLALGTSLTTIGELAQRSADARYATAAIESEQALWRKVVAGRIHNMQGNTTAITRNRGALAALKKGDAATISEEFLPSLNRLRASQIIDRLRVVDTSGQIAFADPPLAASAQQPLMRTAMDKGEFVSGIVHDGHDLVTAIAFPVYARGKPVGAAMFADNLAVATAELKEAGQSEIFVLSSGGEVISTTMETVPDNLDLTRFGIGKEAFDEVEAGGRTFGLVAIPLTTFDGKIAGTLISMRDRTAFYADQQLLQTLRYLTLAGFILLSLLGLYLYMRRELRPLGSIVVALTALSRNDTDIEISGTERKDELADIANAMTVFKQNAIERQRLEQQSRETLAATERRTLRRDELVAAFDGKISGVVEALASAATQMEAAASSMSATASQTQGQSATVASAARQAAANVQTVAATAEELSASIAEIGRQVSISASIAGKAMDETEKTNRTVQGLADAANKIGEVVTLINDIAGQTNLLALNATIEAARAGEAGKGFAVVAQEVKNLANQTAKATEEISSQIGAVQAETEDAVGAIGRIREIISEVNEIATTISSAVEEQGVSTQEIAQNVQMAARGTQEVNNNIESVNRAAGEADAAAGQVMNAASDLASQSNILRSEVEGFLMEVKMS